MVSAGSPQQSAAYPEAVASPSLAGTAGISSSASTPLSKQHTQIRESIFVAPRGHPPGQLRSMNHTFSAATRQDFWPRSGSSVPKSGLVKLKKIDYIEGDISVMPFHLVDLIQTYCNGQRSKNVPCAKTKWPSQSLYRRQDGQSTYFADCDDKRLAAGRFKYGSNAQIIVVKALPGNNWMSGQAQIVVHAGGFSNLWKVWRGESFAADIAGTDCFVKRVIVMPGMQQSYTSPTAFTPVTGGTATGSAAIKSEECTSSSAVPSETPANHDRSAVAPSTPFRKDQAPSPESLKRRRMSSDSSDSDAPIALKAKLFSEKTNTVRENTQGNGEVVQAASALGEPVRSIRIVAPHSPSSTVQASSLADDGSTYVTPLPVFAGLRDVIREAAASVDSTPTKTSGMSTSMETTSTKPTSNVASSAHDISSVKVASACVDVDFIASNGRVVRTRPFKVCGDVGRFFAHSEAARIATPGTDLVWAKVAGRKGKELMPVMRKDITDYAKLADEVKAALENAEGDQVVKVVVAKEAADLECLGGEVEKPVLSYDVRALET